MGSKNFSSIYWESEISNSTYEKLWSDDMSKAKGGTGRGTGSKGWTRWNKTDKKQIVKKNYGAIRAAAKEAEAKKNNNNNNNKADATVKKQNTSDDFF